METEIYVVCIFCNFVPTTMIFSLEEIIVTVNSNQSLTKINKNESDSDSEISTYACMKYQIHILY